MEVILGARGQAWPDGRSRPREGRVCPQFLLRGKALRATDGNKAKFAEQRAQLEATNLERRKDADAVAVKLDGQSFALIRQAGELGVLYGSVSARDLAELLTKGGFTLGKGQIALNAPIKSLGMHSVTIGFRHLGSSGQGDDQRRRSAEEAERQSRGENVLEREVDNLDDLGLEIAVPRSPKPARWPRCKT